MSLRAIGHRGKVQFYTSGGTKIEAAEVQRCPVEDTVGIVRWSNCVGQHEGIIWHKGRRRLRSIKRLLSHQRDEMWWFTLKSSGVLAVCFPSLLGRAAALSPADWKARRRGLISDVMFRDGYAREFNETVEKFRIPNFFFPRWVANAVRHWSWTSIWLTQAQSF